MVKSELGRATTAFDTLCDTGTLNEFKGQVNRWLLP